jgi:hypothetical protein
MTVRRSFQALPSDSALARLHALPGRRGQPLNAKGTSNAPRATVSDPGASP